MGNRKKRNMAVLFVISLIIIPLYFLSTKMEESLVQKESAKALRAPAVQDARKMDMRE